jgi:putative transposase
MDTRKIAGQYRLTQWSEVIRRRTESGLNVRGFCDREGIRENTYYYWQRKLREAACGETGAALPAPGGWAAVVPAGTAGVSGTLPIEIGKCRVLADRDTDERLLAKVCCVLASL